jgi:hypothetical protein
MRINYLIVVFAISAATLSVNAEQTPAVRNVAGEIGWIDIQAGKLELNKETPAGMRTTAYRITENETRVTDPADEKFLNVGDLRAGQYVTVEAVDGQEDRVVSKITVEPMADSKFQQAFGELKSIDNASGTFILEEKIRMGQEESYRLSNFVYDTKDVVVMRSPNKQPVELMLNPGDVVRVEFVDLDGMKKARYITLYSPTVTKTTTTVTTTTMR